MHTAWKDIQLTRYRLKALIKAYRFWRQMLGAVSRGDVLFPTRGQVFRKLNLIRSRILSLMLQQRIALINYQTEKASA